MIVKSLGSQTTSYSQDDASFRLKKWHKHLGLGFPAPIPFKFFVNLVNPLRLQQIITFDQVFLLNLKTTGLKLSY